MSHDHETYCRGKSSNQWSDEPPAGVDEVDIETTMGNASWEA